MTKDDLDGPNDQRVIIDERLLNCPESYDGIHLPVRRRDGQRCAYCDVYIRDSFHRPIDIGRHRP